MITILFDFRIFGEKLFFSPKNNGMIQLLLNLAVFGTMNAAFLFLLLLVCMDRRRFRIAADPTEWLGLTTDP
jgi:hypothetical protein